MSIFLNFKKGFPQNDDVMIFCLSKDGLMDLFVQDAATNIIRSYRKENFISVKTVNIRYRLLPELFFIRAENRFKNGFG